MATGTDPKKTLPPIPNAGNTSDSDAAEEKQGNQVLTDDMPAPPGVVARARRRRVPKEQKRKGPFVKYVGEASHRVIRPEQWKSLQLKEIKDPTATHTWSPKNDYIVECDKFSDEQLDYLLCDDVDRQTGVHQFLEVDWDDDGNLVQVPYEDD